MNLADFEEKLYGIQVAFGAGQMKRGPAVVVTHVHVKVL
jgi:hypothetical protein